MAAAATATAIKFFLAIKRLMNKLYDCCFKLQKYAHRLIIIEISSSWTIYIYKFFPLHSPILTSSLSTHSLLHPLLQRKKKWQRQEIWLKVWSMAWEKGWWWKILKEELPIAISIFSSIYIQLCWRHRLEL